METRRAGVRLFFVPISSMDHIGTNWPAFGVNSEEPRLLSPHLVRRSVRRQIAFREACSGNPGCLA
jgi:hypothetical protein